MLWSKLIAAQTTPTDTWVLVGAVGGNDTSSVVLPAGLQDGDVGILFDTCTQTTSVASAIPSGWTSLYDAEVQIGTGASRHRSCFSYKVLNAALSGTVVTGIPASAGSVGKVLVVLRPSFLPGGVTFSSGNSASTVPPTLPSQQTVANGGGRLNLQFGYWRSSNTVPISGNALTPVASNSFDLKPDFGGTVIGDGTWKLAFGVVAASGAAARTVDFGTLSSSSTYAVMISGCISISS